jgi:hypothetical protein
MLRYRCGRREKNVSISAVLRYAKQRYLTAKSGDKKRISGAVKPSCL